ncbi:GNAT family N-acetyltransferase [Agrobacterium sp. SHOUNA12C]|uniref:Acetyltransferase n=1 Tax=Rhizobium rhizogenes NBRC 13257 TaxID=1220581 RepID=A0AA87U5V1_RHIRH|nr:GNAT family N-acetyltransferase [Rhizobium rhizogenes]KAA6490052.1 GNAT family N-acetyltransferase [Agrobacterium sp. ICMP 7243]MCJ9719823.1 GNAT family N-acetyltransferase [Agrobacterium sp. BETTINA12B]MCJ9755242.1 GNAT family N-acetyltransferase [Agrobacterium sp. SHOUNA12C]OCJ05699.1 GNAT family acetyltransferase [Agrobacterium sp. 13-626]OCJ14865.1 GNAT family acetyltransferase [Agrobacterium sp. B133/95]
MNSELQDPDRRRPRKAVGVEIRAAAPSDAEGIALIANLPGFRAGTLRLPFQSIEETRQWLEKPTPGAISLVALLEGQIVGNAGLRRHDGRQIHTGNIGMGVHDDFIGRGIGSALFAALVDTADNWLAIKRLQLTVYVDNGPAIRLYEKFGFETEGRLKAFAFRNGEYVDAFTMARIRM